MKTGIFIILATLFICSCEAKKITNDNRDKQSYDTLKTDKTTGDKPSFKRKAPEEPKPLVVGDTEYSAPVEQMGCIVAMNKTTKKELWRKQIYTVEYKSDLEKDVQDVFITSITGNNSLINVKNEKGEVYELDPITQTVVKK